MEDIGCHIGIECAPKQFKFLQKGFCSQNFLSIIPYLRELRMIGFQLINSLAITGCIFHNEHTISPVCLLCHWMTCLLEYCQEESLVSVKCSAHSIEVKDDFYSCISFFFFLLNFLISSEVFVTCLEIYWNYTVPYLEITLLSKCFFQHRV